LREIGLRFLSHPNSRCPRTAHTADFQAFVTGLPSPPRRRAYGRALPRKLGRATVTAACTLIIRLDAASGPCPHSAAEAAQFPTAGAGGLDSPLQAKPVTGRPPANQPAPFFTAAFLHHCRPRYSSRAPSFCPPAIRLPLQAEEVERGALESSAGQTIGCATFLSTCASASATQRSTGSVHSKSEEICAVPAAMPISSTHNPRALHHDPLPPRP